MDYLTEKIYTMWGDILEEGYEPVALRMSIDTYIKLLGMTDEYVIQLYGKTRQIFGMTIQTSQSIPDGYILFVTDEQLATEKYIEQLVKERMKQVE